MTIKSLGQFENKIGINYSKTGLIVMVNLVEFQSSNLTKEKTIFIIICLRKITSISMGPNWNTRKESNRSVILNQTTDMVKSILK